MSQAARRAQEAEIASPCINVCKMDERSGWCLGCRRSLEEIACWSAYGPDQKRTVLAQLPARKSAP